MNRIRVASTFSSRMTHRQNSDRLASRRMCGVGCAWMVGH